MQLWWPEIHCPVRHPALVRQRLSRRGDMKPDIHPAYNVATVSCGCGNTFTTRSTSPTGQLTVEVSSACHPFYTGKQKILDTGGRVARFEKRFGKRAAAGAETADK